MDIKDRGTIKWTAMMLPEHVELLKQLEHEQQKVKKPELDEQAWQEIEEKVCEAMADHHPLLFIYWMNGFIHKVSGRIHHLNQQERKFHIVTRKDEDTFYLPFDSIVYINRDSDE
ncbi:YolD-like family protein [Thalassorhabdus alkalitolerans]|uniref:YolD-like family protein n=1 Tax=Thalassorhabdus alkalitolerans TaxID=2282697 RepID=A0ABW0YJA1_9BACI